MKTNFNKFIYAACAFLLTLVFSLNSGYTHAQVGINEGFEAATALPTGWTNSSWTVFSSTGTTAANLLPCTGIRSARTNLWTSGPQRNISPPSWISNGDDLSISFDYKIVNFSAPNLPTPAGWGSVKVQYSTDGGTTYTDYFTIDDNNHITSASCANVNLTIPGALLPDGNNVRIRWFGQWANPLALSPAPDYYFYLDNVVLLQEATSPPACNAALTTPANNSINANISGALAWSAASGVPTGYNVTVTQITGGPTVIYNQTLGSVTSVNIGTLQFSTQYSVDIVPFNSFGAGTGCTTYNFTTQDPPSPGVVCFIPLEITSLPYTTTDNTINYGDDYESVNLPAGPALYPAPISTGTLSGSYLGGDDVVYSFTPSENMGVNITIPTGHGTWLGLYVFTGCPFSQTVAFHLASSSTGRAINNLPLVGGTTYYIVISTFPSPQSAAFTLNIEENIFDCPQINANIGSACNDNDPGTFNDVVQADCTCAGTPYDCPQIQANFGAPCNDGNPGTFSDIIQQDCTCAGTPYDCPLIPANIGTACNDNNPLTVNDVIQANCICEGTLLGEGSNCADPLIVGNLPYSLSGNTSTYGNTHNSTQVPPLPAQYPALSTGTGANSYLNGDEVVVKYTPSEDLGINISVTNNATWVGLWVFEGCPFTSIVAYHTSTTSEPRNIFELPVFAGNDYYIVISTWPAPQNTNFDLLIEENLFDCPQSNANIGDPCDDGDTTTYDDLVQADCSCAGTPYDCPQLGANIGDGCNINGGPGQVAADCTCEEIAFVGCTNGTTFGTLNPLCNGPQVQVTNAWVNEFTPVNILNQATYTFTTTPNVNLPFIFITITDASNNILATGITPLVWQATYTGVARFFSHGGADCSSPVTGSASAHIRQVIADCSTIIYDCPLIPAFIGDACNDGDPTTYNDTVQADCTCAGIPYDCLPALANIGDPCDDGNPSTVLDVIQADCTCAGGPAPVGSICGAPFVVTDLTYTTSGNTANFLNDYTTTDVPPLPAQFPAPISTGTGSNFYLSGPEVVYSYTPSSSQLVNISLDGLTSAGGPWVGLWVFAGCPFTSIVAYHTAISGTTRAINNLPVTAGQTYYVVVSTWLTQTASTEYNLTISKVLDCPGLGDIGDACDDGNPGTFNDVIGAGCICAGTPFDCPALAANIGDACDDGDAGTENDTVGEDCICAGTPITGCNVIGGTVSTNDQRTGLCKGDGQSDFIQFTVTGNVGAGFFGIVRQSDLGVVATNANGLFNIENLPAGNYFAGHVSVENLSQLSGITNVNQLSGCFDLSNQLAVTSIQLAGGTVTTGGVTTVCSGNVTATVSGNQGPSSRFVLLNQTATVVIAQNQTGVFNFTPLANGIYRIVHISFSNVNLGTITPPTLPRCVASSNLVTVTKVACPSALLESSPNPTSGTSFVTFSVPTEEYTTLEVYDMSGRKVAELFNGVTESNTEYRLEFNGLGLPNGVYIYRLTNASEVVIEKFMIAR